jgi:hypothetical protein
MLMKALATALCMVVLTGCAHAPVISDFSEAPGTADKGSVLPLEAELSDKGTTYLFLIHGVGDHCPGYALGRNGWLTNGLAEKHGLVRVGPAEEPEAKLISSDQFVMGKRADSASVVSYETADFTYRNHHIRAVEITWSRLTQWIKTQQLGYDRPGHDPGTPDADTPCGYTWKPKEATKSPPARVLIDRAVKEDVFDRKLADAILYTGTYGKVIQRGIAEAICRSLGGGVHKGPDQGGPDGQICNWPDFHAGELADARFLFITHSLGSRALYDTLLGLTGDVVKPGDETFDPRLEVPRSRDAACEIIGRTSAVYMMANQLSMLGLANVDPYHLSADGSTSFDSAENIPSRGCGVRNKNRAHAAKGVAAARTRSLPIVEVFAEIRKRAEAGGGQTAKLSVVSFNDTNDLLTWSIPSWYSHKDSEQNLHVTNVFVSNSAALLGLMEHPAKAHAGYFSNDDVWSIITCGASCGRIDSPCK